MQGCIVPVTDVGEVLIAVKTETLENPDRFEHVVAASLTSS
jgi:hypothetical protein